MALTSLQVYVDPPPLRGMSPLPQDGVYEFCKNERGRETIKLNVIVDPNDANNAGEILTIRLMKARRDRNEEVIQAQRTLTLAGAAPTAGGYQLEWDIRDVVYSPTNPFCVIRRGDYFFRVEHSGGPTYPSGVTADTDDFRVTVMTVERLGAEWIFGATNRSNDDRAVRFQPRLISGIEVLEVSKNHPIDAFSLVLSFNGSQTNPTLSWAGGMNIPIDTSIPGGIGLDYLLPSGGEHGGHLIVAVDPRLLPNADTQEFLLVDRLLISRDSLRRWLDAEAEWVEHELIFSLIEPGLVVSDYDLTALNVGPGVQQQGAPVLPSNYDYDIKTTPVTYYPPVSGRWINVQLPYWHPLAFEYMIGALENTRIVDIPPGWIHRGASGYVTLVPFNQSLAYNFTGLVHVHALRGVIELPSFWRYRYWSGVPDQNRRVPSTLIEIIGLRAAVKGLAVLGQAFRGGYSSQSASRGGVSESVAYTASATYGIYSATIEEYKKRLTPLEKQVKRSYFGITLMAL